MGSQPLFFVCASLLSSSNIAEAVLGFSPAAHSFILFYAVITFSSALGVHLIFEFCYSLYFDFCYYSSIFWLTFTVWELCYVPDRAVVIRWERSR